MPPVEAVDYVDVSGPLEGPDEFKLGRYRILFTGTTRQSSTIDQCPYDVPSFSCLARSETDVQVHESQASLSITELRS